MIVVSRFEVPTSGEVLDMARGYALTALQGLGRAPGFRGGTLSRAVDEPALWALVTEWDGAGSYRRALGRFDVRMALMPLAGFLRDEPSAFEPVARCDPGAPVEMLRTDRAEDADVAGPQGPPT